MHTRPKGFEPMTIGIGIRYSIQAELRADVTVLYRKTAEKSRLQLFLSAVYAVIQYDVLIIS